MTTTSPTPDRVTLTRDQLAALLAHHADVLAARWRAVAPGAGAWEVAAALSLTSHAMELTADVERPAVAELLDSMLTFPVEQPPAAPPVDRAGLRDCIAAAIWEQQNPGRRWADCEYRWRADAEEDADAVLAVLPRPAAPDGLRARIADVLAHADGHRWADGYDRRLSPAYQRYLGWADQVLAALPTTDQAAARAAALREVADFYERVLEQSLDLSSDPRYFTAVRDVVMGLRRRADETQQDGAWQPEAEAAATLARDCLDRPAVIRWCADRVRSTDGDYAIQAAAEYLDDLALEAEEATEAQQDGARRDR